MVKITDKQKRFCKEYIIDLNATQAAIRAGYSEDTAKEQGSRLLTKVHIQEKIAKLQKKVADELQYSAEDVLKALIKQAGYDAKDFFSVEQIVLTDNNGKPYNSEVVQLNDWDKIDGTLIQEIKQTRDGIQIKLPDRQKALEMIGRHFKMFTDKHEISGKDGDPVKHLVVLRHESGGNGKEDI